MATITTLQINHDFACDMDDADLGARLRVYLRNPTEHNKDYLPEGVHVVETVSSDDTLVAKMRTALLDAAVMLENVEHNRNMPSYGKGRQYEATARAIRELLKVQP